MSSCTEQSVKLYWKLLSLTSQLQTDYYILVYVTILPGGGGVHIKNLCMHVWYKILQGTGLEAGLASGNHATAKTTDIESDVSVCILVKLSKKRPKFPRLQHKARLKYNDIPQDILTKLHTCPIPTKKIGQQT